MADPSGEPAIMRVLREQASRQALGLAPGAAQPPGAAAAAPPGALAANGVGQPSGAGSGADPWAIYGRLALEAGGSGSGAGADARAQQPAAAQQVGLNLKQEPQAAPAAAAQAVPPQQALQGAQQVQELQVQLQQLMAQQQQQQGAQQDGGLMLQMMMALAAAAAAQAPQAAGADPAASTAQLQQQIVAMLAAQQQQTPQGQQQQQQLQPPRAAPGPGAAAAAAISADDAEAAELQQRRRRREARSQQEQEPPPRQQRQRQQDAPEWSGDGGSDTPAPQPQRPRDRPIPVPAPPPPDLSLFDGPPPSGDEVFLAQRELKRLLGEVAKAAKAADGEGWFDLEVDKSYVPDYNEWVPPERENWIRRIQKRVQACAVHSTEQLLSEIRMLHENARAYNTPGNGKYGSPEVVDAAERVVDAAEDAARVIAPQALPFERVVAHHLAAKAAADAAAGITDSRRRRGGGAAAAAAAAAAAGGAPAGGPARGGSAARPPRVPTPGQGRGGAPRRPVESPGRTYRMVEAAALHAGGVPRRDDDVRRASGDLRAQMPDWMPPPMPVAAWGAGASGSHPPGPPHSQPQYSGYDSPSGMGASGAAGGGGGGGGRRRAGGASGATGSGGGGPKRARGGNKFQARTKGDSPFAMLPPLFVANHSEYLSSLHDFPAVTLRLHVRLPQGPPGFGGAAAALHPGASRSEPTAAAAAAATATAAAAPAGQQEAEEGAAGGAAAPEAGGPAPMQVDGEQVAAPAAAAEADDAKAVAAPVASVAAASEAAPTAAQEAQEAAGGGPAAGEGGAVLDADQAAAAGDGHDSAKGQPALLARATSAHAPAPAGSGGNVVVLEQVSKIVWKDHHDSGFSRYYIKGLHRLLASAGINDYAVERWEWPGRGSLVEAHVLLGEEAAALRHAQVAERAAAARAFQEQQRVALEAMAAQQVLDAAAKEQEEKEQAAAACEAAAAAEVAAVEEAKERQQQLEQQLAEAEKAAAAGGPQGAEQAPGSGAQGGEGPPSEAALTEEQQQQRAAAAEAGAADADAGTAGIKPEPGAEGGPVKMEVDQGVKREWPAGEQQQPEDRKDEGGEGDADMADADGAAAAARKREASAPASETGGGPRSAAVSEGGGGGGDGDGRGPQEDTEAARARREAERRDKRLEREAARRAVASPWLPIPTRERDAPLGSEGRRLVTVELTVEDPRAPAPATPAPSGPGSEGGAAPPAAAAGGGGGAASEGATPPPPSAPREARALRVVVDVAPAGCLVQAAPGWGVYSRDGRGLRLPQPVLWATHAFKKGPLPFPVLVQGEVSVGGSLLVLPLTRCEARWCKEEQCCVASGAEAIVSSYGPVREVAWSYVGWSETGQCDVVHADIHSWPMAWDARIRKGREERGKTNKRPNIVLPVPLVRRLNWYPPNTIPAGVNIHLMLDGRTVDTSHWVRLFRTEQPRANSDVPYTHTLVAASDVWSGLPPNAYPGGFRWLLTPNGQLPSGKNLALDFLSWDDLQHRDEGQTQVRQHFTGAFYHWMLGLQEAWSAVAQALGPEVPSTLPCLPLYRGASVCKGLYCGVYRPHREQLEAEQRVRDAALRARQLAQQQAAQQQLLALQRQAAAQQQQEPSPAPQPQGQQQAPQQLPLQGSGGPAGAPLALTKHRSPGPQPPQPPAAQAPGTPRDVKHMLQAALQRAGTPQAAQAGAAGQGAAAQLQRLQPPPPQQQQQPPTAAAAARGPISQMISNLSRANAGAGGSAAAAAPAPAAALAAAKVAAARAAVEASLRGWAPGQPMPQPMVEAVLGAIQLGVPVAPPPAAAALSALLEARQAGRGLPPVTAELMAALVALAKPAGAGAGAAEGGGGRPSSAGQRG